MSMLVTRKELLKFAEDVKAYDITYEKDQSIQDLKKYEMWLNEIAWSKGTYGFTSILYQGEKSKKYYVIK